MSLQSRHPRILFLLIPGNQEARDVVANSANSHLLTVARTGQLALGVGLHIQSRSRNTLATLGRGSDVDIVLESSSIARIQCSFELCDLNPDLIMLFDRSHGHTTQVFGDKAIPFRYGRPRQVVIKYDVVTTLGMGGPGCDLIKFYIQWIDTQEIDVARRVQESRTAEISAWGLENPRSARTVDETPTAPPSQHVTTVTTRHPATYPW